MKDGIKNPLPEGGKEELDRLNPESLGIEFTQGLELFDNDIELYLHTLASFASHGPTRADQIRQAYLSSEWDTLLQQIHAVIGVAGNIGAPKLMNLAQVMEDQLQAGIVSEEHLSELQGELKRVLDTINSLLESIRP